MITSQLELHSQFVKNEILKATKKINANQLNTCGGGATTRPSRQRCIEPPSVCPRAKDGRGQLPITQCWIVCLPSRVVALETGADTETALQTAFQTTV